jgi:hypothetical protein
MPRTLTNGLLYARQLALDTDTTLPANSDTELTRDANAAYRFIRDALSPRYVWETATTLGTSVSSGVATTTVLTIAEIRAAFDESGAGLTAGVPMRRMALEPLLRAQQSAVYSSVLPSYAVQRVGTFTAGSIGAWKIYVLPTSITHVSAMVRYEVTELSSGSDKADVTDGEDDALWQIVGAQAAARMGDQALAQSLMSSLPEALRVRFDVARVTIKPRSPEGAKIA